MKWAHGIFLLLILTLPLLSQTPKRLQVAVLELDASDMTASARTALTDRLRGELLNTKRFDVMERSRMDAILAEQGFQQTGACNSEECIVQVGKILGIRYMIAGSVGKVGRIYTVSARIVDIESGRIMISRTEDCDCPVEKVLTQSMRNLAFKLAGLQPEVTPESTALAPAILSITGNPVGAEFTIGRVIIGTMPLKDCRINPGSYRLRARAKGYKDVHYNLNLNPGENKEITIVMEPKVPSSEKYWSIIIPGLGQVKQGRKMGWVYMIGTAAAGAYYAYHLDIHNTNLEKYDRLLDVYRGDVNTLNRDAASTAYDKAESSYNTSNYILYGIAGLYAVNLLDAFLIRPAKRKEYTGIQTKISPMYCNLNSKGRTIGLSLEVGL